MSISRCRHLGALSLVAGLAGRAGDPFVLVAAIERMAAVLARGAAA